MACPERATTSDLRGLGSEPRARAGGRATPTSVTPPTEVSSREVESCARVCTKDLELDMDPRRCPACRAAACPLNGACTTCGAWVAPAKQSGEVDEGQLELPRIHLHEALVLVTVLGLLLVLFVPEQSSPCVQSVKSRAQSDVLALASALDEYARDHEHRYPDSLEALVAPDATGYRYLANERLRKDPWKHEYHYAPPIPGSANSAPRIWSSGKDGISGTDDDIDCRALDEE